MRKESAKPAFKPLIFALMIRFYAVFAAIFLFTGTFASAQSWKADVSWFKPDQTYIKLYFAGGTVAEVDVADLLAHGFPDAAVDSAGLHVYELGREIPIEIEKQLPGSMQRGDKIRFVTQRQPGKLEKWAYHMENLPNAGTGTRSLYSDTLVYWLTWNSIPGLRYNRNTLSGKAPFYQGYRDTVYLERDSVFSDSGDLLYFEGGDTVSDLSSYTENEGNYWSSYDLRSQVEVVRGIAQQNLTNFLWRVRDSLLTFEGKFMGLSSGGETAVKRANIELFQDLPDGTGAGYFPVATAEWNSATARILRGTARTSVLRDTSRLSLRIRVENRSANKQGVNLVYFDWLKFSYYRGFEIPSNLIRTGFRLRYDGVRSVKLYRFLPSDTVRVYVPGSGILYNAPVNPADSTFSFFPEPAGSQSQLHVLVKNRNFSKPLRIQRLSLRQNLISPDNEGEFLIITRAAFVTEAQRYAAYRGQQSGLRTQVVIMDDIWELFDHGTARPIALKRFLHFASTQWARPPRYVFLVGDATEPAFGVGPGPLEVPSFGVPPSDDWFVQNWNGIGDFRPEMALGRLTARTTTELRQYQSKVRDYERQTETGIWRKRIVLLSGGNSNAERAQLLASNRTFARTAVQSPVGADTVMVAKTSNDPLGVAPREDLKDILDDGVLLLHFFGHSAPNSWDLLTDDPATFSNVGRPNIVLSLGCYSGRFTSAEDRIISEQFVFAPNASVAYIGGSGAGQTPALLRYGTYFYTTLFTENQVILGDVIRRTKRRHFEANQMALMDLSLLQNSLLLGDPAIRLVIPDKPDYLFKNSPYTIRPEPTNVADSTMRVRVDLLNNGRRPVESMQVKLEQTRPDNTVVEYTKTLSPFNISTFTEFAVRLRNNDVGVHQLRTVVDSDGQIDETSKLNNIYQLNHQVFSTSADILFPNDQGVATSRTPRFSVASPTFNSGVQVAFELDTVQTFTNPLQRLTLQGTQLVLEWQPPTRLDHGQNYWWRVRVLSNSSEPLTAWRTATFFVDTTLTGVWWYQNQKNFDENSFSLTLEKRSNKLAFIEIDLPVSTESSNYDYGRANNATFTASTRVNGVEYGRRVISFHVLALDGKNGRILIDRQYILHGGQYATVPINDDLVARQQGDFTTDMAALKDGDYVISRIRHVQQVSPSAGLFRDTRILPSWSAIGGFKAGNGVNGNQASQLDGNSGYILFGKKGAKSPSETSEYIIRTNTFLKKDTVYKFNAPGGDMVSTIAGPALKWRQAQYRAELTNFTAEASVEVFGLRGLNESPVLLKKTDRFAAGNQQINLDDIDSERYPYMQLKAVLADSSRTSTPQIPYWRIEFDPVPEIALDPFSASIPRDTIQEGGLFQFSIDVSNLSPTIVDSVFIDYFDRIDDGEFKLADRDTLIKMPANTSIKVSSSQATLGKVGAHQWLVQVRTKTPDQYAYNNLFSSNFLIVPDGIAPKVEVFLNRQVALPVSSPITDPDDPDLLTSGTDPEIEIRWRDENELFLLNRFTLLDLYFNGEKIEEGDPRITFVPAASIKNNRATVIFKPQLPAGIDSVYQLTIFARDEAANIAESAEGYHISFRVPGQTGIPSLYPYPNPMSDRTVFAFQLNAPSTGQIDRLRISIYTLSGRPVRMIDVLGDDASSAVGGLRIGWNKIEWDGRDQDGNRLANGVYLYKVDFSAGGKAYPVNNARSVEKLVIIR